MILDMDTLYRIHSNEHSRYVTVRAHQHRHRPAPTPLANAQETIDFSLTLSGNSRLILKMIHSCTAYILHGIIHDMYCPGQSCLTLFCDSRSAVNGAGKQWQCQSSSSYPGKLVRLLRFDPLRHAGIPLLIGNKVVRPVVLPEEFFARCAFETLGAHAVQRAGADAR